MLERMADAIRHRGPDGDGFYLDQGVGLVQHRRSRSWIPAHVQRGRDDLDFQRDSMTSPEQTWVP
jgi:asparagine synthetase B (glutamine-hydrolysing)